MALKFVIYRKFDKLESGIRFGNVAYHADLLNYDEGCLGGGAYVMLEEQKKIVCYGDSFDFGKPHFDTLTYIPEKYKDWKIVYAFDLRGPEEDKIDITKLTNENIEYVKDFE